ncbi:Ig-like domain-containing protein, partial [Acinetobacter baumannii]
MAAPSISVADNTYTDLAGNLGTGDVLDGTDAANITFTFSEAVTGFDVSDITVVGGTLTGLT